MASVSLNGIALDTPTPVPSLERLDRESFDTEDIPDADMPLLVDLSEIDCPVDAVAFDVTELRSGRTIVDPESLENPAGGGT